MIIHLNFSDYNNRLWKAALTVVTTATLSYVSRSLILWYQRSGLEADRQKLRNERSESLQRVRKQLEKAKIERAWAAEITKLCFTELQTKLKKGALTPTQALQAYQYMALEAQDKLNCIQYFFSEAEEIADALDKQPKEERGHLYGIPISVKELVSVKGYRDSGSMRAFFTNMASDDCLLIKVLKESGAIPFVRTMAPQSLMSLETSDDIYGATSNPFDLTRTSGGSSGGEAALIACQGSPLGIGGDVGGSIRNPAAYCGIYGLKPTHNRFSVWGPLPPSSQHLSPRAYGPMSRDMASLVNFMKAATEASMFETDPTIPLFPFIDEIYESQEPLVIGYFLDDDTVPAVPAAHRAVLEAVKAMQDKGHKLVEWKPPRNDFALIAWNKTWSADTSLFKASLKGDRPASSIKAFVDYIMMPSSLRALKAFFLSRKDEKEASFLMSYGPMKSVAEWWLFTTEVMQYRKEVAQSWKQAGLDALICPPAAYPAPEHGNADLMLRTLNYTSVFNILDYPAGVVPVGFVTTEDISSMEGYQAPYYVKDRIKQVMVGSEGLPLGVQCVTLPFQEELCLRVMNEIDETVHKCI